MVSISPFPTHFPWADQTLFDFARAAGTYPSLQRLAPARFRVRLVSLDGERTGMQPESYTTLAEARQEAARINTTEPRTRAEVLAL